MRCPVDHSELLSDSLAGYQVHRCGQCCGVALNGNALRDVRAFAALKMHKQEGGAADVGPCPADSSAMMALEYKGVFMCVCSQCLGLWLTPGQWTRLLELVEQPKQTDLSKIGQSLSALPDCSLGASSSLDGYRDILEFIDAIGKLVD